mmetsp:Transcript_97496/g.281311  ORF Transcript_97496/g.281311 Transcript_97496/m.281311 type:complete len:216 (+) Transcript_97496:65-712(+)|eukprot:CAMPEP_0176075250 /NCGR_PEP_ID=MMETSP0120_2-20121206/37611_1 /TAXON_ID=160619 /ORGANISM="Kryptoperidinium foliaceum, Strain CCMP 1326" /LENGTH=215 /DNA_ID=CAMNT_0017408955 /DNA_START=55 /DNA_END=702 /DNA_ORIENTATION=-
MTTADEDSDDGSYGSGPRFWDARYRRSSAPFDWLENYADVQGLIEEATKGDFSCRILHTGCGNSLMPEQMYDEGYRHIVNIDTSAVVIDQMAARNQHRPEMSWLVMDAANMDMKAGEFDVVLDKGCLDTFACIGEDSKGMGVAYLREVARVLKPGGILICISYGAPNSRLPFFEQSGEAFKVRQIQLAKRKNHVSSHYVYIASMAAGPSEGDDVH